MYGVDSLDETIRNPITGLANAASNIASGHGSIFDYGLVRGSGYAGYAGYTAFSGSSATAAEGVEATKESAGLLAKSGEAALGIAETIGPLAILV